MSDSGSGDGDHHHSAALSDWAVETALTVESPADAVIEIAHHEIEQAAEPYVQAAADAISDAAHGEASPGAAEVAAGVADPGEQTLGSSSGSGS